MLNVLDRCGDHAPFLNLCEVILINLSVLNVNLIWRMHSFSAYSLHPIVGFFVLRN